MTKIAIDIVLVPPKEIIDFALRKNREMLTGVGDIIVLDEKTCVPHVSLCMGVIETSELKTVEDILKKTLKKKSPLNLTGTRIATYPLSNGKKAVGWDLKNTPELQQLH